ncbi:hypothetical protein RSOLAG1IB_11800 [Rhizoctonia solani AG-1 IB]|uniref:Uncharacterized protein n=1 Tax=Thanatephorus cucumeris (strain AG1-IB / isolate 7/3/14) TaxID=1108050 RepID=A0A0B7FBD4_THACB|nr:hypothetical protein RSOLAG1IB_11800 [Rhizoctonia solani AG-1 IB]
MMTRSTGFHDSPPLSSEPTDINASRASRKRRTASNDTGPSDAPKSPPKRQQKKPKPKPKLLFDSDVPSGSTAAHLLALAPGSMVISDLVVPSSPIKKKPRKNKAVPGSTATTNTPLITNSQPTPTVPDSATHPTNENTKGKSGF